LISLPTLGYEEGGIELIAPDSIAADPIHIGLEVLLIKDFRYDEYQSTLADGSLTGACGIGSIELRREQREKGA